jgi:hypothetical protein
MSVFVLYFFIVYVYFLGQYFRMHLRVHLYHSTLSILMDTSYDAPFSSYFLFNFFIL